MSREQPDHHDAELAVKVYDLRREAVLRDSRAAINSKFWPRSLDDVLAIQKGDHPLNAPFRQVTTYWEMVYSMVKWGIVHPEYFMETNGEGLFVFAKVAPYLEAFRQKVSPVALRNAEWVSRETGEGRRLLGVFSGRVKTYHETH
jgi:hypothetical protein